jgi:hypothetical protein
MSGLRGRNVVEGSKTRLARGGGKLCLQDENEGEREPAADGFRNSARNPIARSHRFDFPFAPESR